MKINKVILAIFSLQGGGAERFVLTMAEGFKNLGYEPHIVCFKNQIDYPEPDINIHFLPYQSYRWIPKNIRNRVFAKVFDGYVRKNISTEPAIVISNLWQVDQVVTHSKLPNRVFVIHNTLSKEKHIHTYLSDEALRRVYNNQNIVAVSKGAKNDFKKVVQHTNSLTYIHNPIDQNNILIASQELKVLSGLKNKYPVLNKGYIVHVGKFKTQKNHVDLIKAYAQSNQKKALLLVGRGELKAQCEQLSQDLGIDNKVIFAGFQSNPYPLIAQSDGMVLSSIYEGFGIVIAEALALGVPVISTDCESGPRELLPEKNLTKVGNIESLTDKLDKLMQNSDEFKSDFNLELRCEVVAEKYLKTVQ